MRRSSVTSIHQNASGGRFISQPKAGVIKFNNNCLICNGVLKAFLARDAVSVCVNGIEQIPYRPLTLSLVMFGH